VWEGKLLLSILKEKAQAIEFFLLINYPIKRITFVALNTKTIQS